MTYPESHIASLYSQIPRFMGGMLDRARMVQLALIEV